MDTVMKAVFCCILLGCVYGNPINATGQPDVESPRHTKEEKTFVVEGRNLTETLEQTNDGLIIDVNAQEGSSALTVFTDDTYGLLVHRYGTDEDCYISSYADFNATQSSVQEHSSSVFKYRLEPISEINRQYFRHTATDAMKRVCNGASNVLWTEIHAVSDEEMRERRSCWFQCGFWCSYWRCSFGCRLICYF